MFIEVTPDTLEIEEIDSTFRPLILVDSPRWSKMHDDIIMVVVLKFPPTISLDGISSAVQCAGQGTYSSISF